jgi:two-component system LytT family response regulator
MNALRVLTVDDEPLALRRLQLALRNVPNVTHIGSARGKTEALQLIDKHRPDVILLDVRMRDGSGFDIVEKLIRGEPPAVIFVSAFDDHAARAFEVRAIDYILKPVGFDRLRSALDRARSEIEHRSSDERIAELKEVIRTLREEVRTEPLQRFEAEFWVRRNVTGLLRVPVDSINWISADDDYVCLHTNAGNHLLRDTIRGILARLDPAQFIRIHRSSVVRIDAIEAVKRNGLSSREVHLTNGTRLKVGRVYNKLLKQMLG